MPFKPDPLHRSFQTLFCLFASAKCAKKGKIALTTPQGILLSGIRSTKLKMASKIFQILAVLLSVILSTGSFASTITVISDVDIWTYPLPPGNQQLALNMLNGESTVLMSSQTGLAGDTATLLSDFYDARGDITSVRSTEELASSTLIGVGLVILDIQFNLQSPYDASEHSAISEYLRVGGNVAVILETNDSALVPEYNALLAAIGSTIEVESSDRCCIGGPHPADTILSSYLTLDAPEIQTAAGNNLTGGEPIIRDEGYTLVAAETLAPVPLPASVIPLAFGIAFCRLLARRRYPVSAAA